MAFPNGLRRGVVQELGLRTGSAFKNHGIKFNLGMSPSSKRKVS
jgi:hypothetical protein